jgi:hypothetical protein
MPFPLDQWNQLGGNPGGSGFRAVNTPAAVAPAWRVALPGAPGTSSPAIGPDGTIYVGTTNGHLVAVDPGGSLKWSVVTNRRGLPVRTPAVAADGTIYALCGSAIVRDHRTPRPGEPPRPVPVTNFVVSVQPDGRVRWTVPVRTQLSELAEVNGVFLGAPRILSRRNQARLIFVVNYTIPIRYPELGPSAAGPLFVRHLAIVDERGTFRGFNRYEEQKAFIDAHGGGGFGSATVGTPPDLPGPQPPARLRGEATSPAVFGDAPGERAWTIIVPGLAGVYALAWNDADGAPSRAPRLLSTTRGVIRVAAFPNGLLAATTADDRATLVDPATFTVHVAKPTGMRDDATVAGGLRQMYFLVRQGELLKVDTNGAIRKKLVLGAGSVAFPALSGNHVHVSTLLGLRTLSFDLDDVASAALPGAGLSSPAIGADGSVFAAAGKALFGFLTRTLVRPKTVRTAARLT